MRETYSDPSRLFTVQLPQGFQRDEDARSLVFRHSDIDGAVTVTCLRHRAEQKQPDVFEALPSRESMEDLQSYEQNGMAVRYGSYEGTLQNRAEAWRWWTLQRGPVGVVVSFNGSPEAAEAGSALVDELVRGIDIPQSPPVSMEDFTALAADVYAESLKADKPAIVKPLELQTGPQSTLRLDNAYVTYLHEWDADPQAEPRALLLNWFEHLWGEQKESLGPFEEVRGLIYPVVRAAGFGRETKVDVLRRTLLENELELFAAIDTGRTLRFISREDLKAWEGTSDEDVFFYARENLLALSGELELQAIAGPDGQPRAVIIATGDSHDATRIVLPQLYEKLSEVLGPNLLAGLPNRDFLIILDGDDAELVQQVGAQVKIDAETRPYSISGKLYKLTANGLQLSG